MTDELVTFEDLSESALKARVEIKAAPEKVYAAWTQVEQFGKWFGPRANGKLEVGKFDCVVGGKFDVTMAFDDGDRFQMLGEFQELDAPKKIVFTWLPTHVSPPEESLVTVHIIPSDTGSLLTLTHERFNTVESRNAHHGGWGPLLARLATVLAD